MKRSPDLLLAVVVVFIVGTIMTGVAQSAPVLAAVMQQVLNS